MEFSIKASAPEKLRTPCLVLLHLVGQPASAQFTAVDTASGGLLEKLVKRDLDDKTGSLLSIPALPGVPAERVLVVSLGAAEALQPQLLRSSLAAIGKWIAGNKVTSASICCGALPAALTDAATGLRLAAQSLVDATYRFDAIRGKVENKPRSPVELNFLFDAKPAAELRTALEQGVAIAAGQALTRDLGNLPANYCTPATLADTAKSLAHEYKLKLKVYDRQGIEELGMGSFLAVAQGTQEEPRFITLEYKGGKAKAAPIVLVGKGVTFDSGGISLKPGEAMDEMKFDMCGAASVLGIFRTVAKLGLPINLVGLIPATENLPSGTAVKPGDVVTSLSGQTIEILNTDAEGRLILCDALTYAERYKPACVIDIATLTGACIIALGHHTSGLLANDDALAAELLTAGRAAGDRAWQLPLFDEYQEQLKSNFADLANIGGRPAGSITAACFLSRFAKAYRWAHLDIAGTAWKSGADKGATGRPVPLLAEFLIRQAGQ
ncbi:MAG: leucyl aminopeptidase [Candidatus Dactylopiibacterium carminicum]|uniref:Probable cytosol aminopeptidase n=1 Tax=Candidatus Dactylopiibacterium carminicum TaxID=857335 RepID=A0A272EYZ4_9RHOO|nr:leucyl aminopeptidase [Candidatus Dactylopiibacterium carminicum]KAF7600840.1 leucyl aminopeptidase [Candidatus Dactylopiibacterium carminicum]PAS95339.1 MAG: leucyl aminopeptidase [Candidatus Dactylopiibacterium carminicum]PAT00844.1 MAG: leucyl aminopeptidase [Candidatus Dactylopiibacterium carminicum]